MNDNAKKWVAALRSGEFEQGAGCLAKHGKYCCLGVACMVYQQEVGDLITYTARSGHRYFNGQDGALPDAVREWLGLGSDNGRMEHTGHSNRDSLTEINDRGTPFSEIADIIASEPEGLFCD